MKILKIILIVCILALPFAMNAQVSSNCPSPACKSYINKATGEKSCCCGLVINGQCTISGNNAVVIGTIDPCIPNICHIMQIGPYWLQLRMNEKLTEVVETKITKDKPRDTRNVIVMDVPEVLDYTDHLYKYALMIENGKPLDRGAVKVWEVKVKSYNEIISVYQNYLEQGFQGSTMPYDRKR